MMSRPGQNMYSSNIANIQGTQGSHGNISYLRQAGQPGITGTKKELEDLISGISSNSSYTPIPNVINFNQVSLSSKINNNRQNNNNPVTSVSLSQASQNISEKEKYFGPRDKTFRKMLYSIFEKRSGLKDKYIEKILDEEGLAVFSQIFTHSSVDQEKNYEFYEILGDSTVNKCIVWYLSRRFPKLNSPKGVPIIARLKIGLISKKTLASLCEKLNIWDFVSCDIETREKNVKKTLEDIFEAFIGGFEYLVDNKIKQCSGYNFCYNIVKSLLDEMDISLKYDDLYDAKTRLKELFDFHKGKKIDDIRYNTQKMENVFKTTVDGVIIGHSGNRENIFLGEGFACLKQDSEQRASEFAIKKLNSLGIKKLNVDFCDFL